MAIDPQAEAMRRFAQMAASGQAPQANVDPNIVAQALEGARGAPPPLPGAAPAVATGAVSTGPLTGATSPTHAPGEPDATYEPEMHGESGPYKLQPKKHRKSTKPKHLWEEAADEVVDWLLSMSSDIADALLFHGRAPFAAQLSEAEKLAYYRDVLAKPEGRDALMARVGVDGYVRIVAALAESNPSALIEPPAERSRRDQEAKGYS